MAWNSKENPFTRKNSGYSRTGTSNVFSSSSNDRRSPFNSKYTSSTTGAFPKSTSSIYDKDNRRDEDNRIKITSAEERDIFERGTFEVEELKDMKAADENENK